ncbi:MAG: TolC family protein [Nitrospirae bacterium]|nr:TolC family protein [Nitrospirota bacterium]
MRYRVGIILLVLLIIPSTIAWAMETVSLREAIERAMKENPEIRAFTWSVRAYEEDINIARAHRYPKLIMEERFLRTDNPTYSFMAKLNQERFTQSDFAIDGLNNPEPLSDFQTTFRFEQPLYVPEISIRIDMAEGVLKSRQLEFERKKEEVALKVVKAYLNIQKAKAYVEISKKAVEDAKEHKRLARLRYENGLGLYSDLLRAEVALKDAERMLTSSETSLRIARKALGLLLGSTEPFDAEQERPLFSLDSVDVYLNATKQRTDLLSLKRKEEIASRAVDLEKAALLPQIGLGGSYQINDHRRPLGAEGGSYMITAFLRWNFFDATTRAKIRKAKAEVKKVTEYRKGLEKEIAFRVHEAYERVMEKKKELELARASLKEAEEALRLVERRYENSLSPMVDLLDTQVMLDTARAKLVDAENGYIASLAELYYQSGILMKMINQF